MKKIILMMVLSIFLSTFVYAECPDCLVNYWTFDNDNISGNTVFDIVGDSDVINYGATTNQIGQVLEAFSFDGNDYIESGDSDDFEITGNNSVVFWMKPNSLALDSSAKSILSFGDSSGATDKFFISTNNNQLRMVVGNDFGTTNDTNSSENSISNADEWYHVAVVQSFNDTSDTVNFYINGNLDSVSYLNISELYVAPLPYVMSEAGQIDNGGYARGVWGNENYIYLANSDDGLRAYSHSGTSFTEAGHIDDGSYFYDVCTSGNYIYIADGTSGVRAYTHNGASFTAAGHIDNGDQALGVWADGNYVYLANNAGGLRAYTHDGSSFTEAGHIDNGGYARGVWGDGAYIYLANSEDGLRAYTHDGTSFTEAGHIDNGDSARSIWGNGTYIYLANVAGGLRAYTHDGSSFTESGHIDDGNSALDVWGDGTYIYLANHVGGLRAYTHDGFSFTEASHIDSGYALGVWGDGTYIYEGSFTEGIKAYNSPVFAPAENYLTIGKRDSNYWDGILDEVAIFNSSLNSSEIYDLYDLGVAGKSYCGVLGGIPTYTNFEPDSETTNFSECDVTNITSLTLAIDNKGKIAFPSDHSINSEGEDYDTNVKIEDALIYVNSLALNSSFNASATLTFEGVDCNFPYVYYSDIASTRLAILSEDNQCLAPRCTNIGCTESTLTVTVSHFSGYAVNGNASLSIDADDPKYPSQEMHFTADYRNSTDGFISGATCTIYLPDGSNPMVEGNEIYTYNQTYDTAQTIEYNVTCNKTGHSTVTANDTALISGNVPEFSTITLGLGLIAVLAGLVVIRKKK